jgi:hypothetical protein
MRPGFTLTSSPQAFLSDNAGWKQLCFLSQALCLFGKTFFKTLDLFETAPMLHGALLPLEAAGAQLAISSQIKASGQAVMLRLCGPKHAKASLIFVYLRRTFSQS